MKREMRTRRPSVVLVRPDRAARHAIGRNVLDLSRRAAAATAGRAQAAAEAAAVRAVWQADGGPAAS
jgi:NTE family protein